MTREINFDKEEEIMESDVIVVVNTCPICNKTHSVEIDIVDFFDWKDGTPAQFTFPYLSATEREQLISGMCPNCQNDIFGKEE
jgi:hypothetical protein